MTDDAEQQLRAQIHGGGADVALEFAGLPATQQQALGSLAPRGRVALAGITKRPFSVDSYATVLNREAEINGVSDHLHGELDLESIITDRVPLDADQINQRLDALAGFRGRTRSMMVMD